MKTSFASLRAATKRGLTLFETLLVMGIIAVAIVAVVIYYNNTSNAGLTNQAITEVQAYSTGIKSLNSGSPTYGANNASLVPLAVNGGVAPRSAVGGTAAAPTLVNPWRGATTILSNGASFRITMAGVPQDSCVRMLSAGLMTSGGIFAMSQGTATTVPTTGNATTFVSTAPRLLSKLQQRAKQAAPTS